MIDLCEKSIEVVDKSVDQFDAKSDEYKSLVFSKGMALNNIGYVHLMKGDIPVALEFYDKSIDLFVELDNKRGIANYYTSVGYIHKHQGNIPKALDYYHKSLSFLDSLDDKKGMAYNYNNIGVIYKLKMIMKMH